MSALQTKLAAEGQFSTLKFFLIVIRFAHMRCHTRHSFIDNGYTLLFFEEQNLCELKSRYKNAKLVLQDSNMKFRDSTCSSAKVFCFHQHHSFRFPQSLFYGLDCSEPIGRGMVWSRF